MQKYKNTPSCIVEKNGPDIFVVFKWPFFRSTIRFWICSCRSGSRYFFNSTIFYILYKKFGSMCPYQCSNPWIWCFKWPKKIIFRRTISCHGCYWFSLHNWIAWIRSLQACASKNELGRRKWWRRWWRRWWRFWWSLRRFYFHTKCIHTVILHQFNVSWTLFLNNISLSYLFVSFTVISGQFKRTHYIKKKVDMLKTAKMTWK